MILTSIELHCTCSFCPTLQAKLHSAKHTHTWVCQACMQQLLHLQARHSNHLHHAGKALIVLNMTLLQAKPTLTKAGLAAGAAGAAGFLIFQEAGTVLEVLGVLAGVRFLGNRFLFAKDRKQTLEVLQ